jgi:hypothetical protein
MKQPKHHQFDTPLTLSHIIEREIATVYFYKKIIIVEAKEGVNLSYKTAFSLLIKVLAMLKNKPWVYISNRKNSYSVTPTDYKYLKHVSTIKGLAVVVSSQTGQINAEIEKSFYNGPYEIFNDLNNAVSWASGILKK